MSGRTSESEWLDPEGRHLREYWDVLVRRRRVVALSIAIVVALGFVYTISLQPIYRATTTLHIEPDTSKIPDFEDLFQSDTTADAFYQTQYRLIESRSLAQRVIRAVDMMNVGDLAASGSGGYASRTLSFITSIPSRGVTLIRRALGKAPPAMPSVADADNPAAVDMARTVDGFLSRLEVNPVRNTRLANISWSSSNPEFARRVTNAIARAYIDINLEAKFETTEQASQFLSSEIERLRTEIRTGEADLQRYGNERDIISSDERQDTVTQALADLSAQYTLAQTDRIQKQAYFDMLSVSEPSSITEVFLNTLVQRLKSDLAGLQQDYSEMSRTFTDDWPDMQRLRGQIAELEGRIATEERNILDGLVRGADATYQAALDQEQRIESLLEDQRSDAMTLNRNLSTYRALQVGVDSNKGQLESLLERQSETGVSARLQGMRTSNIRVVDLAGTPRFPHSPSVRLNLLLSAVIGLTIGIGIAWFQEYMDNTLKSPEDVEHRTGLANLGLIPSLDSLTNGARGKGYGHIAYGYGDNDYTESPERIGTPELVAAEHPRSALAEAYRNLRTSVLLSSAGQPPKIVLVTSSVPGEGKTTSSLNLAISMAQVGKKVLVIDADLRKPRVHTVLKLDVTRGLVHYLTGAADSLKDVIQKTPIENLWALPCGPKPPNPAELLSSDRTQSMFDSLRSAFDVVVVDSPPVLAVVDALVVLPWTDGVVMVVKGGETPAPVVDRARKKIEEVQGRVLGVILNHVSFEHLRYLSYRGRSEGAQRTGVPESKAPADNPRRIA